MRFSYFLPQKATHMTAWHAIYSMSHTVFMVIRPVRIKTDGVHPVLV